MMLPHELDLRGLSLDRRVEHVRSATRSLGPGESLLVLAEGDATLLVSALHGSGVGAWELNELECDSGLHRYELRRAGEGPRSLRALMVFEHVRLDRLLSEAEWRLEQRRTTEALAWLRQFQAALEQHLATEETVLFPAYLARAPHGQALVERLLREHRVMRGLLKRLLGFRLDDREARTALSALSDLRELIGPHARREEREIAPLL